MVKRRRKLRQDRWRGAKPKPKRVHRTPRNKSLKERLLTAGIWALSLINLVLIASIVSDFFISPTETQVTPIPKNEVITVEVLNACGVQGLANEITQYLREKNFDVVNVGNYQGGFDLDRTFVFDRVSLNGYNAKLVGEALGVNEQQVQPQLDDSLQLMVSVLIGKDYKSLKVYDSIREDIE
ncbi:MAG: LytR C-terminal domain-containing protein [bacterium]